jgi:hypothetical protein
VKVLERHQVEARRDAGISAAVTHSGSDWVEYATQYLCIYLATHEELFCDDVWAHGLASPESPRAFGQVMKNALRFGWMHAGPNMRRSVSSNLSLRPVYVSDIFAPGALGVFPEWEVES